NDPARALRRLLSTTLHLTGENDLFLVEHATRFGERSGDGAREEDRLPRLIDIRESTEGGVVGAGWNGYFRAIVQHTTVGYLQYAPFHRSDLLRSVVDVVAIEAFAEGGRGLRLEFEQAGSSIIGGCILRAKAQIRINQIEIGFACR